MQRKVSHPPSFILASWAAFLFVSLTAHAADSPDVRNLQLPEGFEAAVYAAPDQLSNPVAICFDRQGRLYTAEAHRRVTGAWGVTMSRWWSMEDYAGKTLADRQAMYDRWAHIVPPAKLTRHSDIVRQLIDTDGDGKVDVSRVFADGFNQPLEGNAAGLIEHEGDIFLANAPTLWRLSDSNRDGVVDEREKLAEGIGVRVGVYGHDLHGLTRGPDGRLYFTIGDRGFHLKTKEGKTLSAPTRGAAFRCFPDGSGLEVFHIGLRNPQELAFNDLGDLFTVDNDMGGVDKCRILHVIEGGDSGWDASYQLTRNFREETQRHNHTEPPWFTEKLWELPHDGQPAWINPPLAHLTSGPSGLTHYPGVGLPAEFADNFFICDFRGSSARSGVHRFKLDHAGAGYRVAETNRFIWNICPADIEFGYDGQIYLADWINGWGGDGARRIVRMKHSAAGNEPDVSKLFKQGFADRPDKELAAMLAHADSRVRLNAQFELAKRGSRGTAMFIEAATKGDHRLARLHGIWGLWQIGLKDKLPRNARRTIAKLLDDSDKEVVAQAAKVLGELKLKAAQAKLIEQLRVSSPRVQYFATIALGKLRHAPAAKPIAAMLRQADSLDFNLRHAAALALSKLDPKSVEPLADDASPSVRLAALLSHRMNASPEIARFLSDSEPQLRFEAVRAIHDLPIPQLWNDLADLIESPLMTDATVPFPIKHRVLNANFRLGQDNHAKGVAGAAAKLALSHEVRLEALRSLQRWNTPSPFDRVTWHHRPIKREQAANLTAAISPSLKANYESMLEDAMADKDRKQGKARIQSLARLLVASDLMNIATVSRLLKSQELEADTKLTIFQAFQARHASGLSASRKLLHSLLKDKSPALQIAAASALVKSDTAEAKKTYNQHLQSKTARHRQLAIQSLGMLDHSLGHELLSPLLTKELIGDEPEALDLFQAGLGHAHTDLRQAARSLTKRLSKTEPLGEFQLTLNGGDAKRGKRLFETHAVQCVRCHQVKGFGGDAGPELTKIARELDRPGLLAALIDPPARIAPGFGSLELELKDGEAVSGFIAEETEQEIKLTTLAGETVSVPKADIMARSKPVSAMPSMKEALTLAEIRDLLEYLSQLR